MTTERKILIFIALAFVVSVSIFGWAAIKSRDAQVQAEAQIEADDAVKAEKDKAIADRDAQLKQYQATIAAQVARVSTADQAVQVIDHYLPAAPGSSAAAVVAQKADLPTSVTAQLPDAPSYVVETQGEAVDIAKGALQCDANTKALATCQADLVDAKSNLATETAEVGTLQVAIKGGTIAQRFKAGLKHALCGGAAVGGAFLAGKSNPQTGAIAGGGVFAACELLVLK